jgi:hypothetical protein
MTKRTELERINLQLSQHGRPAEEQTIAIGLFGQSRQNLVALLEQSFRAIAVSRAERWPCSNAYGLADFLSTFGSRNRVMNGN